MNIRIERLLFSFLSTLMAFRWNGLHLFLFLRFMFLPSVEITTYTLPSPTDLYSFCTIHLERYVYYVWLVRDMFRFFECRCFPWIEHSFMDAPPPENTRLSHIVRYTLIVLSFSISCSFCLIGVAAMIRVWSMMLVLTAFGSDKIWAWIRQHRTFLSVVLGLSVGIAKAWICPGQIIYSDWLIHVFSLYEALCMLISEQSFISFPWSLFPVLFYRCLVRTDQ